MKIYFAGSIRGGYTDSALYARLIAHMQRRHTVLTEHVGKGPAIETLERGMTDGAIWAQDMAWLRACDAVIAECSTPSLGVGYELAYAEHRGIPCHIFYDRGKTQLSAMLTGDPYFHIHPYSAEEEIYPLLDQILQE